MIFSSNILLTRFHELAKDIKYNKGGILAATVSYLKMLKMDQIRKNHLEEEVRAQALQNRKLLNKIQVAQKFTYLGGKIAVNHGHFDVISVFQKELSFFAFKMHHIHCF